MAGRQIFKPDGFKNVEKDGSVCGFEFQFKLQYYRFPWSAAYQAPLSMGFSRQEYWSGCHSIVYKAINATVHLLAMCIFFLKV